MEAKVSGLRNGDLRSNAECHGNIDVWPSIPTRRSLASAGGKLRTQREALGSDGFEYLTLTPAFPSITLHLASLGMTWQHS